MTYDLVGNLLTLTEAIPPGGTPADGQTTTFVYDALNRTHRGEEFHSTRRPNIPIT